MKPFRVSIAATLGVIAVLAVGFMGMREGTVVWAASAFCLTLAFLLASTLKAALGPRSGRAGAFGFALFGWVYLATIFGPFGRLEIPPMPHAWLAEKALERLHPTPEVEEPAGSWQSSTTTYRVVQFNATGTQLVSQPPRYKPGSVVWAGDGNHFRQSAHAMAALVFGVVGMVAGRSTLCREPSES